jgi:iron complex transport system permease protein
MHKTSLSRYITTLLLGLVLVLVVIYISVTNGTYDIAVVDVFKTLFRINPTPEYDLVIFEFRLPRILIAGLVGLGLAIAGTIVQGITKNGLADPGIMGINSGAGTAIVVYIFFYQGKLTGSSWIASFSMPFFGLVGGLASAFFIYLFAWKNGRLDTQRLILCGLAISSGLSAVSLYITLKMNSKDFEMATVWVSGSIWNANWRNILSMLPWFIILLPIILIKSHILDLFQLEESTIKSLGVSTEREKMVLLLSCVGLVGACVSVSGNIGFVGLIAPHIAKRLVGIHHHRVVPISGVIGMLLVLISDFIGKTFFHPVELPIGIVISLIGVPYFIYLLFKSKA